MRKILFRGKTDKGEWVVGAYYKQEEFYGDKEDAHLIITSKDTLDNDFGLWYSAVLPETVGQYTGLTTNGTKIFEGDIVNTYNGTKTLKELEKISYRGISFIGVIKWNITEARFYLEHLDGTKWHLKNDRFYEIIGNIHDNPELLKEREG